MYITNRNFSLLKKDYTYIIGNKSYRLIKLQEESLLHYNKRTGLSVKDGLVAYMHEFNSYNVKAFRSDIPLKMKIGEKLNAKNNDDYGNFFEDYFAFKRIHDFVEISYFLSTIQNIKKLLNGQDFFYKINMESVIKEINFFNKATTQRKFQSKEEVLQFYKKESIPLATIGAIYYEKGNSFGSNLLKYKTYTVLDKIYLPYGTFYEKMIKNITTNKSIAFNQTNIKQKIELYKKNSDVKDNDILELYLVKEDGWKQNSYYSYLSFRTKEQLNTYFSLTYIDSLDKQYFYDLLYSKSFNELCSTSKLFKILYKNDTFYAELPHKYFILDSSGKRDICLSLLKTFAKQTREELEEYIEIFNEENFDNIMKNAYK